MVNKIYVGNLSFNQTSDDLKKAFTEFGEITEAIVIQDKFSGRSKGFGFVTFAADDSVPKAIEGMNGKEVDGREIKVSEAKPMESDRE